GYKMIFGCSFGNFSNGANGQLYKKYPDVLFEEATGTQIEKNQSQYFGAGEDTIYLSGMAAGAASKKGVIGYTVPFGTPEVVRHANAFTLGAQATHPGAKVKLIWTNAWYSPPKETAAASNLAPFGPKVSAKTKSMIAAKQKAIVSGKFDVFQGPLYDQKGKLMVPKGKTLKVLPDLYTMQWLVKGVIGKVSKVTPPG